MDYIEYNNGNPLVKGETAKKFTHLFPDPNTFYMKFIGFNNKKAIKLTESDSIEGTIKIIDIHYDGKICRGRALNTHKVNEN